MKCQNVRVSRQLKVLGLIALGFLSGFYQTNAYALGTPSGTNVDNKATLNYSVGGVPQTLIESAPTGNSTPGVGGGVATSFVVDNKINLTVAEVSGSYTSTVPGKTAAVIHFTVTNIGNTTQNFLLSTTQMTGSTLFTKTDNYDVSGCAIHPDANGNKLDDDPVSTSIANLAPDATLGVWVYCDTPITQVNNDYSIVALTAEAREAGTGAALTNATVNTAGVDVVFADAAGTNDVVLDAKHSAQDAYLVVSPTLTVSKVVSVICDPINGNSNPKNIPGAIEQYAITITNNRCNVYRTYLW